MKTKHTDSVRSRRVPQALVLGCFLSASLMAAPVDSEILVLVDGQTFSDSSFDLMLEGVAQAFERQSFIDSVAGGPFGSIAASVMVFSTTGTVTEIPWMEMSSAQEMSDFAAAVRDLTRPGSLGFISYEDAISAGAASIASSVAEGTLRQMTIVEDGSFFLFSDTGAEIQAARDSALASEVDTINSVVYNATDPGRVAAIETYYQENVVGGLPAGEVAVIGGSSFGAPGGALGEAIADEIGDQVSGPTIDVSALSIVPEPSSLLFVVFSSAFLLVRRRR